MVLEYVPTCIQKVNPLCWYFCSPYMEHMGYCDSILGIVGSPEDLTQPPRDTESRGQVTISVPDPDKFKSAASEMILPSSDFTCYPLLLIHHSYTK
jgi:hypothetical protein